MTLVAKTIPVLMESGKLYANQLKRIQKMQTSNLNYGMGRFLTGEQRAEMTSDLAEAGYLGMVFMSDRALYQLWKDLD